VIQIAYVADLTDAQIARSLLLAGRARQRNAGDVHAAFDFEIAARHAEQARYVPGAMYAQAIQVITGISAIEAERRARWKLVTLAIELLLAKDAR
jgi:hypothetical protein